jgi:hypothetical protein
VIIRDIRWRDYEELRKIHAQRDYKFELPEESALIEEAFIVESETGEIIAAGFALRVPEIVLLMGNGHPVVKLEAIRRIHEAMRESLRRKGYQRALAVVSPALKGYVRHMKRKFGWVEEFPCFRIE